MLDSISLFRIIKSGFVNFWRNLWLSAAATMVMVITLVIFSVLFILFALTSYSISTIQNTVDISVYLNNGVQETQARAMQQDLMVDPRISRVVYKTPEQVRQEFVQKNIDNKVIVDSLNELNDNPFGATLNIQALNLEDYPGISEALNAEKYKPLVRSVNYEDNRQIIERLDRILRIIIALGLALIVIFSLIAILVIFNTITLTIYNRREEVEIMRLVGATNSYIRGPFLVESGLYSIFATLIGAAVFYPVFYKLLPNFSWFVNPQVMLGSVNIFNFWYLVLMLFLIAVALSVVSTLLAIRKYLKI